MQDDLFEELAPIVELRIFGGLSIEKTARVLASSTASVTRGSRVARKWLVASSMAPTTELARRPSL